MLEHMAGTETEITREQTVMPLASRACSSLLKKSSKCREIGAIHRAFVSLTNPYVGSSEKSTHFGYENVTEEEKASRVYDVFERVADKYDIMNDAMSFGIHRLWKDCFVMRLAPPLGTRVLDVAGGTGDIAFRCLNYFNSLQNNVQTSNWDVTNPFESTNELDDGIGNGCVVCCDINQAMLEIGMQRAKTLGYSEGLSWILGDAENLPIKDNEFDAYTIAFGIRNVVHLEKALSEAYRILKPGGRFMCLEFSHLTNNTIQRLYDSYSFQVIPVFGQIIARDWKSYQYLVESIRKFPSQREFEELIKDAGFKMTSYENLSFGIASIHSGFKI